VTGRLWLAVTVANGSQFVYRPERSETAWKFVIAREARQSAYRFVIASEARQSAFFLYHHQQHGKVCARYSVDGNGDLQLSLFSLFIKKAHRQTAAPPLAVSRQCSIQVWGARSDRQMMVCDLE